MTGRRGARGSYAKGRRTREAIIEAAIEHFRMYGYRGAPLAAIAESVGVTRSGLLHHFGTKEALLATALERRDEVAREALRARAADSHDTIAAAPEVLDNAQVHNRGLVQLFAALVGEAVSPSHPAHDQIKRRYESTRDFWTEQLRDSQSAGHLATTLDPETIATLLIAVLDGLQVQWLYDENVDIAGIFGEFLTLLRDRI